MSVVVAGQFPPPVHGMAVAMAAFADLVEERQPVVRLDLSPGVPTSRLHHHGRRLGRTLGALVRLVRLRRRCATLFAGCDAGLGMLYTTLVVATGRALGYRCFVHHHSYAYVTDRSRLMGVLVRAAGPDCRHLVLCGAMRDDFAARYPRAAEVQVLSCAYAVDDRAVDDTPGAHERNEGRVVLGHLSNLSRDKGLATVFDTLAELTRRGVAAELVLAGPPASPADEQLLDERLAAHPDVRWLGPVSGAEKRSFFAGLDYFLLPSRYSHEAAPLVAFEALASGVPVLTFGRGCLREIVADQDGIIPPDAEFATTAADIVERGEPGRAPRSRDRFEELLAESAAAADRVMADFAVRS